MVVFPAEANAVAALDASLGGQANSDGRGARRLGAGCTARAIERKWIATTVWV
jgi:hypothetical protein